jgi:uncharacterized protein
MKGATMAGKMVHFELPAADAERAKRFWSGVFGWEFGDSAMPGMEYYMVRTGEDQGGAVYPMPDAAGSGTVVYFDTDDIDAALGKVREGGGSAEEKSPIPHVGWSRTARTRKGTPSRCSRATSLPAPDAAGADRPPNPRRSAIDFLHAWEAGRDRHRCG